MEKSLLPITIIEINIRSKLQLNEREMLNMNGMTGNWIGWLAILLAVIGFFFAPFWLGGIAVILGLITLASPKKALAWWAIGLGVISFIIPYF